MKNIGIAHVDTINQGEYVLKLTYNPYIDSLTVIFFVLFHALLILEALTPNKQPKSIKKDTRDWNVMEEED